MNVEEAREPAVLLLPEEVAVATLEAVWASPSLACVAFVTVSGSSSIKSGGHIMSSHS